MVETVFDSICDYITPSYASDFITAVDEIQKAQDPPYSQGAFFCNIRSRFRKMSYMHYHFMTNLIEPITAAIVRTD